MLTSDQIGQLKLLLASSGWKDVMHPAIATRGSNLIKMLMKASSERPEPYRSTPDDVIRGEIRGIEWLLSIWMQEVSAHDHNQRLDELDRNGQSGEPVTEGTITR